MPLQLFPADDALLDDDDFTRVAAAPEGAAAPRASGASEVLVLDASHLTLPSVTFEASGATLRSYHRYTPPAPPVGGGGGSAVDDARSSRAVSNASASAVKPSKPTITPFVSKTMRKPLH
jgi:hypothetical protein